MSSIRNSFWRRLGVSFVAVAILVTSAVCAAAPRTSHAATHTFTVYLQAGHSPSSCGVGNLQNGLNEAILNEQVTIKTYNALRAKGINVTLLNPITLAPSLPSVIKAPPAENRQYSFYSPEPAMLTALTWPERFDTSITHQADLVISLHHNAYSNAAIRGYEIYYASATGGDYGRTAEDAERSKQFAQLVEREFAKGFHVPPRTPAVRDNATNNAITKSAPMPAVVIEAGYMSNDADFAACTNETNQQSMANKIADAVDNYRRNYWEQDDYVDIRTSSLTAEYSRQTDTITVNATLAPSTHVSGATMKVWTSAGGEGSARLYNMTSTGSGQFSARIGLEPFGFAAGEYQISVQGVDLLGRSQLAGTTTVAVTSPSGAPSASSITARTATATSNVGVLTAAGVSAPGGVQKVEFAVWSEINGQDDTKWYTASLKNSQWTATMKTTDLKDRPGTYIVHAYVTDVRGQRTYLGETTVTFKHKEGDIPELLGSLTYRKIGTRLVLTASDVRDASGVQDVQFAFWSTATGQKDLAWYPAKQSGSAWSAVADLTQHPAADALYTVHAYATDTKGNNGLIGKLDFRLGKDKTPPTAGSVEVVDRGSGAARVFVENVRDDGSGVSTVDVPVWTDNGGQDDLKWYKAEQASDGTWRMDFSRMSHNNENGPYNVHVYAEDAAGNRALVASTKFTFTSTKDTTPPTAGTVQADRTVYGGQAANVTVSGISDVSGIAAVRLEVAPVSDSRDGTRVYSAVRDTSGAWKASFNWGRDFTQAGQYTIVAYATDRAGNEGKVGTTKVTIENTALSGLPIMGRSQATVAQLVNMQLTAGWSNSWYGMTVEQFCRMYYDICEQEGVRAEVAYAQMMHETASLRYGNLVVREQNNFAGLGASGNEVAAGQQKQNHRYTADGCDAGIVFLSVENGIKSQIQHLKGYASTSPLTLVSAPEYDRFGFISRGCAPTLQELSGKWATDPAYGDQVYCYVEQILGMSTIMPRYDVAIPARAGRQADPQDGAQSEISDGDSQSEDSADIDFVSAPPAPDPVSGGETENQSTETAL